jgi:hypothetical protein
MFESNKETNYINQIIYYAIVCLKFSKKKKKKRRHTHTYTIYITGFFLKNQLLISVINCVNYIIVKFFILFILNYIYL